MDISKGTFLSIEQLTDRYLKNDDRTVQNTKTDSGASFQDILRQKSIGIENVTTPFNDLKFSKHAAQRLEQRDIKISAEQMERLTRGADKAKEKGIRDSLVIVDELAFIVNVPNKTVVTAMDKEQANENVFTNINGAVIM